MKDVYIADELLDKFIANKIDFTEALTLIKLLLENKKTYDYCSFSYDFWHISHKYGMFSRDKNA